jgi:hypothetical protein
MSSEGMGVIRCIHNFDVNKVQKITEHGRKFFFAKCSFRCGLAWTFLCSDLEPKRVQLRHREICAVRNGFTRLKETKKQKMLRLTTIEFRPGTHSVVVWPETSTTGIWDPIESKSGLARFA